MAELSLYELAFVGGGPDRVVDTALVRMHREGRLVVDVNAATVAVVEPHPADEVEAALLAAVGPGLRCPVPEMRARLRGHRVLNALGRRLRARRLVARASLGRLLADCLGLLVLFAVLLMLMAAAMACAAVVVFALPGDGPVLGPLAATVVLVAVTYLLGRFGTRAFNRPDGRRPRRARTLLGALAHGGPAPAGWRLAPDAWTPSGLSPLGAVALGGLGALLDERSVAVFRGLVHPEPARPRPWIRRPRRHSTGAGTRPRSTRLAPAPRPGRPRRRSWPALRALRRPVHTALPSTRAVPAQRCRAAVAGQGTARRQGPGRDRSVAAVRSSRTAGRGGRRVTLALGSARGMRQAVPHLDIRPAALRRWGNADGVKPGTRGRSRRNRVTVRTRTTVSSTTGRRRR